MRKYIFILIMPIIGFFSNAKQVKMSFNDKEIKSIELLDNSLTLKVFCQNKECGYISFKNGYMNTYISSESKFFKGRTEINKIELLYKNMMIIKKDSKELFSIKCTKDIFDKTQVHLVKTR